MLNKIKLSEAKGDIESFFKNNNVTSEVLMSSGKNESIDGTGKNPSVKDAEANRIVGYMLRKFEYEGQLKVIDVGTGLGHMVKSLINNKVDGYGIEGFAPLALKSVVDKKRICACDTSTFKIEDETAFKCANLTTSFEVFEHVHRECEDLFIRNLAYLSDYHLCSIHMFNWPGVNKDHCNIKHECCWIELFRKYNIKCEVLGHRTGSKNSVHRDYVGTPGSSVAPPVGGSEEFRDETKTHHWEESMFCILDMRDYKFK